MTDFMSNSSLRLSNRYAPKTRYASLIPQENSLASVSPSLSEPSALPGTTDFGFDTRLSPADSSLASDPIRPGLGGGWMDGAKMGLQAANIGLGIYSALEQSKMNKFMRGYYGNEMARNKADFNNNVISTNAALDKQARTSASMNGFAFGSAGNQAAAADAMDKWGVKKFE